MLKKDSEKKCVLYRVVRRVSPGPMPLQNGWVVMSKHPLSKLKPICAATDVPKFFLLVYGIGAREDIFVGFFAGFGDCAYEFHEFVAQSR